MASAEKATLQKLQLSFYIFSQKTAPSVCCECLDLMIDFQQQRKKDKKLSPPDLIPSQPTNADEDASKTELLHLTDNDKQQKC